MKLQDRVAVVTGGSSGLGLATVSALREAGARVAVLDLNPPRDMVEDVGRLVYVETDVARTDSVEHAMARIDEYFDAVDVCVNAAGVSHSGKVVGSGGRALPLEQFRRTIDVNLVGAFDVLRHCAERMARNQPGEDGSRGVIINVASVTATQGQTGQAAYAASKAGLVGLMLPAARDLAPLGIRVLTVAPGVFDTAMLASLPDRVSSGMTDLVLQPRRPGRPSEFAALVRHAIENDYLNATSLTIDGGIRLV